MSPRFSLGCASIGDGTLLALKATQSANITWLDLSGCTTVTDLGIEALGTACPVRRARKHHALSHYQTLSHSVTYCHAAHSITHYHVPPRTSALSHTVAFKITHFSTRSQKSTHMRLVVPLSITLIHIPLHSHTDHACKPKQELRHLDLSGCPQLTDESFQQLAFGCRRLQWLAVMFCTNLTDMSVNYLAGGCSELTTLHLHGLPKLTNSALQTCLVRCRRLRILSVYAASGITRERVSVGI